MNEIDNITLQYFTNKVQYDTLLKRKGVNVDSIYLSEKKFYRKRILDLTKKAFRNEVEDNHVKNTFDNYIRTCINYLKFSDKKDIYQEQYDGLNMPNKNNYSDNNNSNDNELNCIPDISHNNVDYIMGKSVEIKKCKLDSFIINVNKNKKDTCVLPKKHEVNITKSEYKTKGITSKKKNITNKYDDQKK